MSLTKDKARENLAKLVQKFKSEIDSGRAQEYNEEETKHSFIEPFLKDVLGWDVANHDEVGYEHPTSRGRVDYSLKIDGKVRLFIEAKPVHVDLVRHIPQAVGYGYSRKDVPFVLLTDFEGIKLFDVTIKPSARNLRKGLKLDLSWQKYEKEFDKLWLLSKDSVGKGDLDKLLLVKPKDRLPVDKAILEDLKDWREVLAKDIYHNNPELFSSKDLEKAGHYLKEITQKILGRLIFIRFCEDRRLTHISSLKDSFDERTEALGTKAYEVILKDKFKQYQILFNSDLFTIQDWEGDLKLDFSILSGIVFASYDPYQFDVIPLEVLGNIYEQYLGYIIRLTGQQVKYELKPEVRKAGGVYYTPEYIVGYIVRNTVGKLLEELSPAKAKKLRILDPACGSGSFLIRAYEEMLEYYRRQKKAKPKQEGQAELGFEHKEQEPRLSINEKREILRQHIFGVDIDEQAVEVTKLSLMLKMLEGEYGFVAGSHLLPMLDHNIRCGNSLISGDTLELKKYFGDDWFKFKPFNWDKQFPDIVTKEGGFDVVIGNPPYGALFNKPEKLFLIKEYPVIKGQPESYEYFLFRAMFLCRKRGYVSFIVPTNFVESQRAEGLRETLIKDGHIKVISNFRYNVWPDNASETLVIVFQKNARGKVVRVIHPASPIEFTNETNFIEINQNDWLKASLKRFLIRANAHLIRKIEENALDLGKVCDVSQGIIVYKTREESAKNLYISDKATGKEWKKLLDSKSSLKRYGLYWGRQYLKYGNWLWCPRDQKYFELPKILFIRLRNKSLSRKLIGTYDKEAFYNRDNFNNIILKNKKYSLKYVLGLFNSTLINYWYRSYFDNVNINPAQVRLIPVYKIEFSNSEDERNHNKIVALVDVMLDLDKSIQNAKGNEKEQIQQQIGKTDKEIDDAVYKLYGMTEEERRIIEGTK